MSAGRVLPLLLLLLAATSGAAATPPAGWTAPLAPFHVAGNLYYVGSKELASWLVTTPEGHVLINSNLEESVPQIRKSIEELGFKLTDVKVLLVSQAHFDHVAGSAAVIALSGARYMVMDADVPVVESGGEADFAYSAHRFPAAKVDRVLHDGDVVRLGGTALVAHLTPGHTRGCTTWTLDVDDGGRKLRAVIVGGPYVNGDPGYELVGNRVYPSIADDFARGFRTLRGLGCDLFLGAHGAYFGMEEKLARARAGARDVFLDPAGYRKLVDECERDFQAKLAAQKAGRRPEK